MYKTIFKRAIDLIMALTGLILFSPVLALITLALYFANDGHPFFYQKRVGKNGRIFTIAKFKTMNDRRDGSGSLLPDEVRLTRVGRFLRAASLDELPQLFNVLRGDMSLIGPRPLLVKYLPRYSEWQMRRHEVTPGITGWAQVNGRNALSWEEKFEYDVEYVDKLSFLMDLRIIFRTVKMVVAKEGISAAHCATMEEFKGSENKSRVPLQVEGEKV